MRCRFANERYCVPTSDYFSFMYSVPLTILVSSIAHQSIDGNVVVLREQNYLEKGLLKLIKFCWYDDTQYGKSIYRDKTIIIVFDPVYIYKNPDYDTRTVMKKLIQRIEDDIPSLKRINITVTPHVFFCMQRIHAVVGIQTNIMQRIIAFLPFDVEWMSDSDDEIDTRKIIFVNPCCEKITILNPDVESTEQKNRILVSRDFEHMEKLMISRTLSRDWYRRIIMKESNEKFEVVISRTLSRMSREKFKMVPLLQSHRNSCCLVQ